MSSPAFWMSLWYITSLCTLFMNKIILADMKVDAHVLGLVQMTTTAVLGAVKVYGFSSKKAGNILPTDEKQAEKRSAKHPTFWRDMVFVGIMRGATVVLGLVGLSHVAVSFVETIKASAPLFTVIFARIMLGTSTSWPVVLSLFPVMLGLVLCSATELSFDMIGFLAAASNNCIDCVQNVFSKKLLRTLSPVELQFYTSVAAAALQLPPMIFLAGRKLMTSISDENEHGSSGNRVILLLLLDAVSYHFQSVTAYCTMSLISPVSQSVANTAKRSLLIYLSILYFGNKVSLFSGVGMISVIFGVGLYNYARLNYPPGSSLNSPTSPSSIKGSGSRRGDSKKYNE